MHVYKIGVESLCVQPHIYMYTHNYMYIHWKMYDHRTSINTQTYIYIWCPYTYIYMYIHLFAATQLNTQTPYSSVCCRSEMKGPTCSVNVCICTAKQLYIEHALGAVVRIKSYIVRMHEVDWNVAAKGGHSVLAAPSTLACFHLGTTCQWHVSSSSSMEVLHEVHLHSFLPD